MSKVLIYWLVAALILDACDIITTYLILSDGGVELNQGANDFFRNYGLGQGLAVWGFFKLCIIGIICVALNYIGDPKTEKKHGAAMVAIGKSLMLVLVVFLLGYKTYALVFNLTALI